MTHGKNKVKRLIDSTTSRFTYNGLKLILL